MMKTRFCCALAIVAASLVLCGLYPVTVRATTDATRAGDPPGETCYHFPLITVCCAAWGCYIK